MSLRGVLRGFGLKVGRTTPRLFAGRIRELTEHHPTLSAIAKAVLAVHEVLLRELNGFERQVRKLAKSDSRVRLAMTAPGVGAIVGLTYVAAIDDPGRLEELGGETRQAGRDEEGEGCACQEAQRRLPSASNRA